MFSKEITEKFDSKYNLSLEDKFSIDDLHNRKLYLNSDIDECVIDQIVYPILRYNAEDKGLLISERKPIFLYVTSNGGSVNDGFELIDVILASKTPVYTINLGYQYSMGFLIGLSGHKRFGTINSTYLMHDGNGFIYNSTSKIKDQMEFQVVQEKHIKDYILSRSRITSNEYDTKVRVEWYMYADQAKEKGFIDYIIGVDCDIDEIL